EHRHVVGHQIPVALIGVELDGKTAHVPGSVLGATLPGHGGESYEHRRLLALFGEGSRAGQMLEAVEAFEEAMAPEPRACTMRSGMRSWSKWVIFSRRMKSLSSAGPRTPALSEDWLSAMSTPWLVVSGPMGVSRTGPPW